MKSDSYITAVWTTCAAASSKRIQTIQNMAARAILGRNRYDSAAPLIKDLHWVALDIKRKIHELVLFYKIYMDKGTCQQKKRLSNYRKEPNINTRGMGSSHLFIPAFRTNYMKESFYIRNIKAWNGLPSELKSAQTPGTFKAKLFKYFFQQQ